jgi:hypothetical protein
MSGADTDTAQNIHAPEATAPPADLDPSRIGEETPEAWIYGFPQGGDEWKAARRMAVGGSTVGAVLGLSRYATPAQAVAGMVDSTELRLTPIIIRGTVGEAPIRRWVCDQLGLAVREVGLAIRKGMPWMRASPDGIYDLPGGGLGVLEIKVVSSRMRRAPFEIAANQALTGQGPIGADLLEEHRQQVHYTAGVLGAQEITYCALIWPDDALGPGLPGSGTATGYLCVWRLAPDHGLFRGTQVPAARAARMRAEASAGLK